MPYLPIIFANYFFAVVCLRREVQSTPPQFSLAGFFYWFGKVSQKYILLILASAVVGGIAALINSEAPNYVSAVFFVFAGLLLIIIGFVAFRLVFVSPLAILHEKPVLINSWRLTHEHYWRILGGYLIHFVVLTVVYSLVSFPIFAMARFMDKGYWLVLVSILQGLYGALLPMVINHYCCTTYRILLGEQSKESTTN